MSSTNKESLIKFKRLGVELFNMLSKAKIKYIKSLHVKKHRVKEKLFFVEGAKSVIEFIESKFTTAIVYGTDLFWKQNEKLLREQKVVFEIATEKELIQAGTLNSNNAAIALVNMPVLKELVLAKTDWTLALDTINDPGNLGTIIRIADWYGIQQILISTNSADVYNPKVVNTTKGSLTRVHINYVDLPKTLSAYKGLIIGADMVGEDVHTFKPKEKGVIIMGGESHGISQEVQKLLTTKITIPRIGSAESLNVAVATAIICDNIVRVN